MGLLHRLGQIVDQCQSEYENDKIKWENKACESSPILPWENRATEVPLTLETERGISVLGDNYKFFGEKNQNQQIEKQKLIYMDPPFFSMVTYKATVFTTKTKETDKVENFKVLAYEDRWTKGLEDYLINITKTLLVAGDNLRDDGVVWVHLDWHVVHYVKIILDEILGEKNFINEIIWHYKSGGGRGGHFARKHDTLLVYGKTPQVKLKTPLEKSYNRGLKPYYFKGVEEFQDEKGWYTQVNMKDVWNINMVGRTSKERSGYATQKPEELMRRIIESSSEPGDICSDFFGGSGTFAKACQNLERKWISCDSNKLAVLLLEKEFLLQNIPVRSYAQQGQEKNQQELQGKNQQERQEKNQREPQEKNQREPQEKNQRESRERKQLPTVSLDKKPKLNINISIKDGVIRLIKYYINKESISIIKGDEEKLKKVLQEASLNLISYYIIEIGHKEKIKVLPLDGVLPIEVDLREYLKPTATTATGKGAAENSTTATSKGAAENSTTATEKTSITVKVFDIFGNVITKEVNNE